MRIQKAAYESGLDISPQKIPFEQQVENFEKKLIIDALEKVDWIQTRAAELLGTTRSIIRYKMKKYGIKRGYVKGSL